MARKGKSERSRHERKRAQKPTILIAVEGDTEELYFGEVKRKFRAQWIKVEKPKRTDPRGIVLAARNKKKELETKGLSVEPWVVFDAEAREDEEARSYGEALKQAESWGIHVANSSPCFEYWALLHYSPGILVETPEQAVTELAKPSRAKDYKKPGLPFDELWGIFVTGKPTNAATSRRKTLVECGEDPRGARPVTYVDQLMGAICETGGVNL